MRLLLPLLVFALAFPVHAQLTPDQRADAQKTIQRDLNRLRSDPTLTQPQPRLKAMIGNGSPEQQKTYRELKSEAASRAANPTFNPKYTPEPVSMDWNRAPHQPGNAESHAGTAVEKRIDHGLDSERQACAGDSGSSAYCQALGTSSF